MDRAISGSIICAGIFVISSIDRAKVREWAMVKDVTSNKSCLHGSKDNAMATMKSIWSKPKGIT